MSKSFMMNESKSLTPQPNQRQYFVVQYSSLPNEEYLAIGYETEATPGYVGPERYVRSISFLQPVKFNFGDIGENWKYVRTGWDNVLEYGCAEKDIPLPGIHFSDLAANEQAGIRSFCAAKKLTINLDWPQHYQFEKSNKL